MISRSIIAALILLASQLGNGVALGDKKESIPEGSNIFVESTISGYKGNVHSRQRRVGPEPPENPMIVKDTGNTTEGAVMNGSTTTAATASEAKDMEETSVKPKDDDDDDDDDGSTVKSVDNSGLSTSGKSTKRPDASGNQTKAAEGVTNKIIKVTNKTLEVMTKTEEVKNETVEVTTITTTASPVTTVASTSTTTAPATNVTANCPGVNATLGISENDSRCAPMTFPSTPTVTIDDTSPEMKELLLNKYNTSGRENNATKVQVEIKTLAPSWSSTTESPQEAMESREELVEKSQQIRSEAKNEKAGLPGGVVALLIAIAFAVMAVIAYVGLTLRKRYLEYRYGNRELLVNDFDTNDINNFEL
ncbi:uncharacterized protein LOC107048626 [Diachasma alloeum]|uniref:uncharacterized protein LOC107048626 n=1 Tax=Diachasma alloeum TaxID=454923 RepID=UPI000738373F|nr:uncharacterized protein LOC107048626 [Diachasma alloeum]XP_015127375.1 uncharacterized protein LOC107048626 [Diachasma alloeum]XP_015127376.1 uncharacterized protein LOC107048626 [Diachasma alloeum]